MCVCVCDGVSCDLDFSFFVGVSPLSCFKKIACLPIRYATANKASSLGGLLVGCGDCVVLWLTDSLSYRCTCVSTQFSYSFGSFTHSVFLSLFPCTAFKTTYHLAANYYATLFSLLLFYIFILILGAFPTVNAYCSRLLSCPFMRMRSVVW